MSRPISFPSKLTHPLVVVALISLVVLVSGGRAISQFAKWKEITDHLGLAYGVVVKRELTRQTYRVDYEFQDEGRTYHGAEVGKHYKGPSIEGEGATVWFSEARPDVSTLDLGFVKRNAQACGMTALEFALGGALYAIAFRKFAMRKLIAKSSLS